jgi:hypothetical protein
MKRIFKWHFLFPQWSTQLHTASAADVPRKTTFWPLKPKIVKLINFHIWKTLCEMKGASENFSLSGTRCLGGVISVSLIFRPQSQYVGSHNFLMWLTAHYLRGTLLLSPQKKSLLCRQLPSCLGFGAFLSWRTWGRRWISHVHTIQGRLTVVARKSSGKLLDLGNIIVNKLSIALSHNLQPKDLESIP